MKIISHRGYWKTIDEKNTEKAFERSFSLDFGTETDIRDFIGDLVISHDVANSASISVNNFFEMFNSYNPDIPLALNIKADGLQGPLKKWIKQYQIKNYFTFDMSIPDTLGYIKESINFFSRQSEYELEPAFYGECKGIWLDCFEGIWYTKDLILNHISNNKLVALVSPELHNRNSLELWIFLKQNKIDKLEGIILCTDFPEDANTFFK
jgi:hypothetical protein